MFRRKEDVRWLLRWYKSTRCEIASSRENLWAVLLLNSLRPAKFNEHLDLLQNSQFRNRPLLPPSRHSTDSIYHILYAFEHHNSKYIITAWRRPAQYDYLSIFYSQKRNALTTIHLASLGQVYLVTITPHRLVSACDRVHYCYGCLWCRIGHMTSKNPFFS